jgi:hypothetical protein
MFVQTSFWSPFYMGISSGFVGSAGSGANTMSARRSFFLSSFFFFSSAVLLLLCVKALFIHNCGSL